MVIMDLKGGFFMPQVYFDNNDNNQAAASSHNPFAASSSSSASLTAKTMIYLCLAILISGGTAVGLPYLLIAANAADLFYGIFIGSAIVLLVLSFIINFLILRSQSKVVPIILFVIYSLAWGVLLSSFTLIYPLETMGYALLVTGAIFGVMGLFGYLTKRSLEGFGATLAMLMFGAIIISIINIFVASSTVDWIISYVLLAVVIGFVAVDFNRLRRMNELRINQTNLALFMAINLYVDFAYIFVRILPLIAASRRN